MLNSITNNTAATAETAPMNDLDIHMQAPSHAEISTTKQIKTVNVVSNGALSNRGTHRQTKQSGVLNRKERNVPNTQIVRRRPHLLTMPPEMRNRIVKYVVTEPEAINVDAKRGFKEPGLLLACKHLRKEAGPVFYHVNKFFLDQQDHNSDIFVLWKAKSIAIQKELTIKPVILRICPVQTPSWPNVKVWVDRVYSGEVDIIYPECAEEVKHDQVHKVQRLCLNLVTLTAAMKRFDKTPWEGEVEHVHNVLKATNILWT